MDKREVTLIAALSVVSSAAVITLNSTLPYLGRSIISVNSALSLANPFGISNIALLALITTIQTASSAILIPYLKGEEFSNKDWILANLLTTGTLTRLTALALKTNLIASRLSLRGATLLCLTSLLSAAPINWIEPTMVKWGILDEA